MPDINIHAQDDILLGRYANVMQVSHAQEEFVLDFMFAHPPQGGLVSRLIISPAHIKRILRALHENVAQYEKQFGLIEEAHEPKMLTG